MRALSSRRNLLPDGLQPTASAGTKMTVRSKLWGSPEGDTAVGPSTQGCARPLRRFAWTPLWRWLTWPEVRSAWPRFPKRALAAIGSVVGWSWRGRATLPGRKGSFRPGSSDAVTTGAGTGSHSQEGGLPAGANLEAAGALVPPPGAGQKGPRASKGHLGATDGRIWWGSPRYWLCQTLLWFGYGLVVCTATFSDHVPVRWPYLLLGNLMVCALGILVSHLIRVCSHFGHWTRRGWGASIGQVLLLSLAYGGTCAWLGMGAKIPPPHHEHRAPLRFRDQVSPPAPARPPPWEGPPHSPKYFEFLRGTLVMLAWAGIYLGYGYERQLRAVQLDRARLDASAKEAQLRALQNQLNPHFLFNGLNTIRALIEEDAGKARQAVTDLSDLLRALLRASEDELVPLRQELKTLEAYLHIEKCRYEERLQLEMDVDDGALELLVPPLVLQTLAENAIKHGIAARPEGGLLSCQVRIGVNDLCVRVCNAGTLNPSEPGAGMGLANARERLRLLFGEAARLTLGARPHGMVVAELRLPKIAALS
jgi:two-component system LytT family sensor kinase